MAGFECSTTRLFRCCDSRSTTAQKLADLLRSSTYVKHEFRRARCEGAELAAVRRVSERVERILCQQHAKISRQTFKQRWRQLLSLVEHELGMCWKPEMSLDYRPDPPTRQQQTPHQMKRVEEKGEEEEWASEEEKDTKTKTNTNTNTTPRPPKRHKH